MRRLAKEGSSCRAWGDAPRPSQIAIRPGAGVNGADRITLVWPDGAIKNTWLRVAVKAVPQSGLSTDDVFTFGNLLGETGNAGAGFSVDAHDVLDTRLNRAPVVPGIDNRFDHNRDGSVNVLDYWIALRNVGRSIQWATPPAAVQTAAPVRTRGEPIRRTVLEGASADPA